MLIYFPCVCLPINHPKCAVSFLSALYTRFLPTSRNSAIREIEGKNLNKSITRINKQKKLNPTHEFKIKTKTNPQGLTTKTTTGKTHATQTAPTNSPPHTPASTNANAHPGSSPSPSTNPHPPTYPAHGPPPKTPSTLLPPFSSPSSRPPARPWNENTNTAHTHAEPGASTKGYA